MRFIKNDKLSLWCLSVIYENLDLFVYNKNIPQKYIDFLHRVYSEQIFHEYSSLNNVSEDYMVWFLNPFTKKISLPTITENVFEKLRIVGPNIIDLNLKLSLASESILNSIFCCVPSLKYLDLSTTFCTDDTLLFLERMCKQLVKLIVRGCEDVTNDGMVNLSDGGNLSLEHLDIVDTNVNYHGLRVILSRMPSLQCLRYNNLGEAFCYAHEKEFLNGTYKDIKYNLTELRYEEADLFDNASIVISMWTIMCPNVKKAEFLSPISTEVLYACTGYKNLEELRVKSFKLEFMMPLDAITPVLPIATKLKTLILSCVEIHVPTLVDNFVNLECLLLNDVRFSAFAVEDIKTTETKLDKLIIKDNNVVLSSETSKAITTLISLSKNATILKLNCTGPVPENIFDLILNTMKKLFLVDLSYCNVKMDFVVKFFQVSSMRQINLDLCTSSLSFEQYLALQDINKSGSSSTIAWRTMLTNPDDSDSDGLSD